MKLAIIIIIICTAILLHEPERDYTGLTVAPYPDIAIDIQKEYGDDYIRLLWRINTKE